MQPESCPIVLKAIEGVHCEDAQERQIAISKLCSCLIYLHDQGHAQLLLNLVVFLLERGVVTGIATAMRAIAAGEWVLILPEKDISVSSKNRLRVISNNAVSCGGCLSYLAADRRCISTILKDFPDLARVTKAMFTAEPSDRRIKDPAEFGKLVKG